MKWIDLVRKYFPDANEKQVEFILWEKTAFPLVGVEKVEQQLADYQLEMFANRKNNFYFDR